jgi:outer membrane protein
MLRVRAIYISPDDGATGELEGLEVKSNEAIEVDITKFFTDHLALEVIAATSSQEVTSPEGSLGSVHHLPPTATFQYHFGSEGKVQPYVGAGINYTIFYDQTGILEGLDIDNSFGLAGQVGVDIPVKTGAFNVDLKYVNIDTEVKAGGETLGDLDINPWILGFGFGYRF